MVVDVLADRAAALLRLDGVGERGGGGAPGCVARAGGGARGACLVRAAVMLERQAARLEGDGRASRQERGAVGVPRFRNGARLRYRSSVPSLGDRAFSARFSAPCQEKLEGVSARAASSHERRHERQTRNMLRSARQTRTTPSTHPTLICGTCAMRSRERPRSVSPNPSALEIIAGGYHRCCEGSHS